MTGANYNRKGQVLLIVVMLIAVLLTVVLSLSFSSKTETQLTKLEEENQKALAAAEAGIEEALKKGSAITAAEFSALNIPEGFTGSADLQPTTGTEFSTPLVPEDGQYSFYATSWDNEDQTFSGSTYPGDVTIYFDSAKKGCSNISLEVTMISGPIGGPYTITRKIVDAGNKLTTDNIDDIYGGSDSNGYPPVDGITFYCSTDDSKWSIPADTKLILIRVLFQTDGTRLGFRGKSGNLRSQGTVIISEAKSPTGVTKKVRLFQSYPQIPTDFWVTSF